MMYPLGTSEELSMQRAAEVYRGQERIEQSDQFDTPKDEMKCERRPICQWADGLIILLSIEVIKEVRKRQSEGNKMAALLPR
jgi:hypothetical protein